MAAQAEKQFSIGKPVRIPKALREELEAAIQAHLTAVEKLTAVLDRADGEPDREPSIGAQDPAWFNTDQEYWAQGNTDDCEGDEHDGREPCCEDEGAQCEDEGADTDTEGVLYDLGRPVRATI